MPGGGEDDGNPSVLRVHLRMEPQRLRIVRGALVVGACGIGWVVSGLVRVAVCVCYVLFALLLMGMAYAAFILTIYTTIV